LACRRASQQQLGAIPRIHHRTMATGSCSRLRRTTAVARRHQEMVRAIPRCANNSGIIHVSGNAADGKEQQPQNTERRDPGT
jgi:hypothetical protein